MTGNEYQKAAMRTYDGKATKRLQQKIGWFYKDPTDFGAILNACLGLSGEVGELNDLIKKWVFQDAEIDMKHLIKEVGDVLWYVAQMCEAINSTVDEAMRINVEKLLKRYPDGFSAELSANRAAGDV